MSTCYLVWVGRNAGGTGVVVLASELNWYFPNFDLTPACCFEEMGFKDSLGEITTIWNSEETAWYFSKEDVLRLCDRFQAVEISVYWSWDVYLEFPIPSRSRFVLFRWHNMEAFALLPQQRGDIYFSRSSSCRPYQWYRFLFVLCPPSSRFILQISFEIWSALRSLSFRDYRILHSGCISLLRRRSWW